MTTRSFSATDLPHPRYSLELGKLSIRPREQGEQRLQQQQKQQRRPHQQARDKSARLGGAKARRAHNDNGSGGDGGERGDANEDDDDDERAKEEEGADDDDDDVNLPSTCLPRFSRLAQVIEVKRPGLTLPGRVGSNIRDFLGSYCVIENARPELFVRRDFISQFVDKDKSDATAAAALAATTDPDLPAVTSAANELSLAYFNHVIEEYALDGCQPVPLTSCSIEGQQVERDWVNYSQLHPELNLNELAARLNPLMAGHSKQNVACPDELEVERSRNALARVLELVDWLGYQALQVDCDHLSEMFGWNEGADKNTKLDRVDVSCAQIIGNVDFKQVQDRLGSLFSPSHSDDVLLRALILHDTQARELRDLQLADGGGGPTGDMSGDSNNNSGVVYLQDLTGGREAAQEILVIGMSKAAL